MSNRLSRVTLLAVIAALSTFGYSQIQAKGEL